MSSRVFSALKKSARLLQWVVFSHVWSMLLSTLNYGCPKHTGNIFVQSKTDVQNFENILRIPTLVILKFSALRHFFEKFLITPEGPPSLLLKQALPFVRTRSIRTLDVISEVICVLLRRSSRIGKKRSHLSQHAISELLKPFPSTKGTLWVLRNFFERFA